jgi:stress response protein YsnF
LFLPAEDRYAYAEGLRRGRVLVSVRTEQFDYERILEILDRDGAVDLDKQEASWREEGWTGYPGEGAAASTAASAASQTELGAASPSKTADAPRMATDSAGTQEVVPVYEEQLRVGKRDVSHGRVRIRGYVVETPVNEHVRLHSESVQVERKPVDRPIAAGDALFQDRVIEAEERAEEAVG